MATLEKIRSKSVLLFVIIIVALLAFILGDFLTSGQTYFGSGTTVAKAGDVKVDYTEYQNRVNMLNEQNRNAQNVDADEQSAQVLNEILLEKMLEKEYKDLGIVVTDNELTQAMTGAVPHPAAQQFIMGMAQNLRLQNPSGAAVYDAMMNPQKYGLPAEISEPLKQAWADQEKQLEDILLSQKFARLVSGLFTANDLDARAMYNDVNTSRTVAFAAKGYAEVTDEEAAVTDADRRAAWEEDKGFYRLNEPLREVEYIVVRIEPSQDDRLAAQQAVEQALVALNANEGTADVASDSRFVVNNISATRSHITDAGLKSFVDSARTGQARVISNVGDQYTLAKLLGVTNEIDSINITMIGRPDGASLDSVMNLLNAGSKFADVVDGETIVGQDSVWTSLAGPNVPANIKNALTTGEIGRPFIVTDTVQGNPVTTLYRINRRHAAVPYYELAMIEYTVDPSQETLAKLSADLRTYVSSNPSAEQFSKNAAEAGYTVLTDVVGASSAHLAGMPDSRPALKWIMNADKGQIMPIFQDNKQTYYLAAVVKDVFDGEYMPWNASVIAEQVNQKALRNKKAQILKERYAGKAKDVAGYAKLMGVEPQTTDVTFSSTMVPGLGFGETKVLGNIGAAEKGKVSDVIDGNNSVVVFVVENEAAPAREYNFDEYANQFNRSLGIAGYGLQRQQKVFDMLKGKEDVENNSLKFIQSIGE